MKTLNIYISEKLNSNNLSSKINKKDIYPNKKIQKKDINIEYHNTYDLVTIEIFIDLRNIISENELNQNNYNGNFIEEIILRYNINRYDLGKSYGEWEFKNNIDIDDDLFESIDEYISENPLTDLSNIVYKIYK